MMKHKIEKYIVVDVEKRIFDEFAKEFDGSPGILIDKGDVEYIISNEKPGQIKWICEDVYELDAWAEASGLIVYLK